MQPHQLLSTRSWMPYRPTSGPVGSRVSCQHLSSALYAVGRHPTADTRRFCRATHKTRQYCRVHAPLDCHVCIPVDCHTWACCLPYRCVVCYAWARQLPHVGHVGSWCCKKRLAHICAARGSHICISIDIIYTCGPRSQLHIHGLQGSAA